VHTDEVVHGESLVLAQDAQRHRDALGAFGLSDGAQVVVGGRARDGRDRIRVQLDHHAPPYCERRANA
jgi:hypothetical protein